MDAHLKLDSTASLEADVDVIKGRVDSCSWLAPGLMLLVGRLASDSLELEGRLCREAEHRGLQVHSMTFWTRRSDLRKRRGDLLLVRAPVPGTTDEEGVLEIVDSDGRTVLGPIDLDRELVDLQATLRNGLASLDARTRARVVAFMTSTCKAPGMYPSGKELSRSLRLVRDAMRERLPIGVVSRDASWGLTVDAVLAIDERAFYVDGWLHDEESPLTRLSVISPEGERVDLQDRLFRYRRQDVEEFFGTSASRYPCVHKGFIAFFELENPSRLRNGWIIEMENTEGVCVEIRGPSVLQEISAVRMRILGGLRPPFSNLDELMEGHVHPAISRLQERAGSLSQVQDVIEYGAVGREPKVSVVVPLYRRIDFLEHQLAQFVHDDEIREAELVYVLDSPELAGSLTEKAAQLHELYRLPFRVALLERNAGFAAANNCGASVSTAPLLLFLNSDVLPDKPGWLGAMARFYGSKQGIGALGPKLLYEDDSLQHAGMYFSRLKTTVFAGLWMNRHYFKGLHRSLPAANIARPVPAVTGACLMVARDLFEQIGGFQNSYVQGDHEDSDLCLRLMEEGLENWYLPDAELYHLEAQSYPNELRQRMLLYNCWVHSRMWGERIGEIASREAMTEAVL